VTYGTADCGTAVTGVAKVGSQITYGGANVGTEISITGVDGSTLASKATAGTAVAVAKAGTAITVAKRDTTAKTIGNANVGTAKTVATSIKSATASVTQNAYNADYVEADECLVLTPATVTVTPTVTLNTTSVTPAEASSATIYGCSATDTSVTPAVSNGNITPWSFSDVTVPVAATATSFNPAVASSTKAYVCADGTGVSITPAKASTKTLTPAADNGTITPWTFTDVTVPQAASKATVFNPAVSSSTKIYGVGGVADITPAVAAPSTQTIVPAVANGTITPYTFETVTAAKVASAATTVATGSIATTGTGDDVLVGLGTATTGTAIKTASVKSGTTGDVTVVTEVKSGKNSAAVTISGTAAENGTHNHEVQ
jgi:hypothetical protein